MLGCMLPWVSTPLGSRAGIDTSDGKVLAILAGLALVAGLFASAGRKLGTAYLVCGGLGAAAAFHDLGRLDDARQGVLRTVVTPGFGLYLDVLAFIVLAIAGIAMVVRKK